MGSGRNRRNSARGCCGAKRRGAERISCAKLWKAARSLAGPDPRLFRCVVQAFKKTSPADISGVAAWPRMRLRRAVLLPGMYARVRAPNESGCYQNPSEKWRAHRPPFASIRRKGRRNLMASAVTFVLRAFQQDDVAGYRTARKEEDLAVGRPAEGAQDAAGEICDLLQRTTGNGLPPDIRGTSASQRQVDAVIVWRPLRQGECRAERNAEGKSGWAAGHRHSNQLIAILRRIGMSQAIQHELVVSG